MAKLGFGGMSAQPRRRLPYLTTVGRDEYETPTPRENYPSMTPMAPAPQAQEDLRLPSQIPQAELEAPAQDAQSGGLFGRMANADISPLIPVLGMAAQAISPNTWGGRLGANMASLAMRRENMDEPYHQYRFMAEQQARGERERQKQLEGVFKSLRGTPARLSVDETPQTPEAGRVGMNISDREIPAQVPQITPEQVAQLSGLLPKEAIEPTLGAFRNIGQLPTEADANTRRAFETMADPRFGLMTDREATHGKEGLGWKFKTPTESPSKYQTTYEQDPHTKEWYEVEYQEGREGTRRLGLVTPRTKQEKIDIKPEETANQGFFTRNPSEDIVSKQTGEVTSRGVTKTATEDVGAMSGQIQILQDAATPRAGETPDVAWDRAKQEYVTALNNPFITLPQRKFLLEGLTTWSKLNPRPVVPSFWERRGQIERGQRTSRPGGAQNTSVAPGRIAVNPETKQRLINRDDGRGWVPYVQ